MVYYNFDTKSYYNLYYQKNKEHILERVKNNYIKNKKRLKKKLNQELLYRIRELKRIQLDMITNTRHVIR